MLDPVPEQNGRGAAPDFLSPSSLASAAAAAARLCAGRCFHGCEAEGARCAQSWDGAAVGAPRAIIAHNSVVLVNGLCFDDETLRSCLDMLLLGSSSESGGAGEARRWSVAAGGILLLTSVRLPGEAAADGYVAGGAVGGGGSASEASAADSDAQTAPLIASPLFPAVRFLFEQSCATSWKRPVNVRAYLREAAECVLPSQILPRTIGRHLVSLSL